MQEYKRFLVRTTGLSTNFRRNQNDPPDFWMTHGGEKYAVEVTCVLDEKDRRISQAQWELVRLIESEARVSGILVGRYVLAFREPWINRSQRQQFKKCILEFLGDTAAKERTSQTELVIGGRSLGDIHKYANSGSALFPLGGGSNELGGYVDDLQSQLSPLVERAIQVKARKLHAFSHSALVLYDLYRLADPEMFLQCVLAVPETRSFHEVFVVRDRDDGFVVRAE